MSDEKLIRMANQIARFMQSRPADQAAAGVAQHISDFWEPRMRRRLFEMIEQGGQGLDPLVLAAASLIRPVGESAAR